MALYANFLSFFAVSISASLNPLDISNGNFSAHKFFNVSRSTNISKYLCHEAPSEKKCCSCNKDEKNYWCIDMHLNSRASHTVSTTNYRNSVSVSTQATANYGNSTQLKCSPIITVPNASKHQVEHIQTFHSHAISCKSDNFFNIPVISLPYIYKNYECAKLNGVTSYEFLIILVWCKNVDYIYEDMVFTVKEFDKLGNCIFVVSMRSIRTERAILQFLCPSEEGNCPQDYDHYQLCNMYYAPYHGYKNIHCYKCSHSAADKALPKTCTNKMCSHNSCLRIQPEDYPNTFVLETRMDGNKAIQTKISSLYRVFPFKEFFRSQFEIREDELKSALISCNRPTHCCTCEADCHKYRTCCLDVEWKHAKSTQMSIYKELLLNTSRHYKLHRCQSLLPLSNPSKSKFYYMISSCDPTFKDFDVIKKCISINESILQSYIPAVGKDLNLYRNVYCVYCNGEQLKKYPQIGLVCHKDQKNCDAQFYKKPTKAKACTKYDRQESYVTSTEFIECELCRAYYAPILSGFDNPHCLICASKILNRTYNKEIKFKKCKAQFSKFVPWSYLLSFNKKFELSASFTDLQSDKISLCNVLDVESSNEKECLFKDLTIINLDKFFRVCQLKSYKVNKNITEDNFEDLFQNFTIGKFKSLFEMQNGKLKIHTFDINTSWHTWNIIKKQITNKTYKFLFIPKNDKFLLNLGINNVTTKSSCYNRSMVDAKIIDSANKCSIISNKVEIGNNKTTRYAWLLLNEDNVEHLIQNCYLTLGLTTNKLKIIKLQWRLDKEQNELNDNTYEKTLDMMIITTKGRKVENWSWSLMNIEKYLSFIGTSLSLASCFFVIYIYIQIERLQTAAGMYLFLQCITLVFGDGMVVIDGILEYTEHNRNRKLCRIVGVILHFGLLMVHHWSLVTSFSLMMKFRNFMSLLAPKKDRVVLDSFFSTIIISFLMVLLCFLLDENGIIDSGYGLGGNCMPVKFQGRLFFYIVPVIVSFILSVICTSITLYFIKHQKMSGNQIMNQQKQQLVLRVTLKLVVLLGLIEGIGFIQIVKTNLSDGEKMFNAAIGFIYTLVRSSRGVLLLAANMNRDKINFLLQGLKIDKRRRKVTSDQDNQL